MAKKHVRKMKNDELIKHLFHPKVVEHLRQSIEDANQKPERKPKKSPTTKR
jgi:hypothetical protein